MYKYTEQQGTYIAALSSAKISIKTQWYLDTSIFPHTFRKYFIWL